MNFLTFLNPMDFEKPSHSKKGKGKFELIGVYFISDGEKEYIVKI